MSDLNNLVWEQKYRPNKISDIVLPDETKKMLSDIIESGNIPNFLFAGSSGTGKTTAARAIADQLGADLLFINASLESGIDTLRTTITQFVSTVSFTESRKVVLLDECLSENEKVRIGTVYSWEAVPLKSLLRDTVYPVVSYNMETGELENDTGCIISDRTDQLYEVELESGKKIVANGKHPFICRDSSGNILCRTIEEGFDSFEILCEVSGIVYERVKKITPLGYGRVMNLTVDKNHTFLTENGIITHNCEYLNANSTQPALRGFIDEFSTNAIFIFTCNVKERIIAPLQSRLQIIDFKFSKDEKKSAMVQILKRCCYILDKEGVTYDKQAVATVVGKNFPDFRKTIVELQRYSTSGTIDSGIVAVTSDSSIAELVEALKAKNFTTVMQWVVNTQMSPEMLYKQLLRALEPIIVPQTIPQLILLIGESQVNIAMGVADIEIEERCFLIKVMNSVAFK